MTTIMDEYPERPPSVVLEAVTLRQQAFDVSTSANASTLALEVPGTIKVERYKNPAINGFQKRRFSETIHSSLMSSKRRKSVSIETVESITKRRLSYQPNKTSSILLKPPKDQASPIFYFRFNAFLAWWKIYAPSF